MGSIIKLHGYTDIELYRYSGNIDKYTYNNTVLIEGKKLLGDLLGKATFRPNFLTHFAVGSGTASVSPTDTALGAELGRVAITSSEIITQADNSVVLKISASFAMGVATGDIYEYGLLNSSSGGTLYNRTSVTLPLVKGANDSAKFIYNIVIS